MIDYRVRVSSDGEIFWYSGFVLHRENGPAITNRFGDIFWYLNGTQYSKEQWTLEVYKERAISNGFTYYLNGDTFELIAEFSDDHIKKYYKSGRTIRIDQFKIEWFEDTVYNRLDGPSILRHCGDEIWYQNRLPHREDGPAIKLANGTKYWFKKGKRHREDGAAVIYANGKASEWWNEGVLQSTGSPPPIKKDYTEYSVKVYSNGAKHWYKKDKRHRENGPAIEFTNGHKEWYKDGKRHREDGPAVVFPNGDKEWWVNGKYYTDLEFNEQSRMICF